MFCGTAAVLLVIAGVIIGCIYLISLMSGKRSMSVVELSQSIKTAHLFIIVIIILVNNKELLQCSTNHLVHASQCHAKGKHFVKGVYPQIQVKFHMPFLILIVLYHGISNGQTEYELQILS
jgi:hypothetical protein